MKFLMFLIVILISIPLQAQISEKEIRDGLKRAKEQKNWTPLHFFAANGLTDRLNKELRKKNVDLNARDTYGWTALHHAGLHGSIPIINALIVYGADPQIKTPRGYTLFHISISMIPFLELKKESQKKLITLLIYHKLNIHAKDNQGNTVLHCSVSPYELSLDIISLLIRNRADVNAQNNQGLTALHSVALFGSLPTANYLVRSGANIHIQNNQGDTPLDLAKIRKNKDMIFFLQNKRGFNRH